MLDFVIEVTNKAVEEGETTLLILDDVTQHLKIERSTEKP